MRRFVVLTGLVAALSIVRDRRTGLFELLLLTDEIKQALLKSPDSAALREIAHAQGMTTLRQDGAQGAGGNHDGRGGAACYRPVKCGIRGPTGVSHSTFGAAGRQHVFGVCDLSCYRAMACVDNMPARFATARGPNHGCEAVRLRLPGRISRGSGP